MTDTEKLAVGLGLAGLGVLALVYLLRDAKDKLNPASDKNLAYGLANSIGQGLGLWDSRDTFGTYLAERFENPPAEQEAWVQKSNVNTIRMEQGLPPVDTTKPWNREGNIGLKPPASTQEVIDRNREGYSRDMIR